MNTFNISPTAAGAVYRELIHQHGAPLFLLDCDVARQQYRSLKQALPDVDLYYAVKALPNPDLLAVLHDEGAGFDIASSGEIEIMRELHVKPRRTIHTHPIKRDRDIRDALRYGCTTFVIDNPDELLKFLPYRNRVGILLRVSFRSPSALVDLSKKFGCAVDQVPSILALAERTGIHIKGLSFHVGSQCTDTRQQIQAIETCNLLIRRHHDVAGMPLSILDIGGGFPVAYDGREVNIDAYCAPIRDALAQLPSHVRVIAEPGRFICAPAAKAVTTVVGRADRRNMSWYYLDDGVYGSFSGQIFDHVRYPLEIFAAAGPVRPSVFAGPTCDSIDVVAEDILLPDLPIGTIVVGHMMGAYTAATATEFNSLKKATVVVQHRQHSFGTGFPLPEHYVDTREMRSACGRSLLH